MSIKRSQVLVATVVALAALCMAAVLFAYDTQVRRERQHIESRIQLAVDGQLAAIDASRALASGERDLVEQDYIRNLLNLIAEQNGFASGAGAKRKAARFAGSRTTVSSARSTSAIPTAMSSSLPPRCPAAKATLTQARTKRATS